MIVVGILLFVGSFLLGDPNGSGWDNRYPAMMFFSSLVLMVIGGISFSKSQGSK
jgi:hypothetical protein